MNEVTKTRVNNLLDSKCIILATDKGSAIDGTQLQIMMTLTKLLRRMRDTYGDELVDKSWDISRMVKNNQIIYEMERYKRDKNN